MTLYFIAIIPEEPVASEVIAFKQEIADRFESRKALNSPPHITLLLPQHGDEEWENNMTAFLEWFVKTEKPIIFKLINFERFPNRRRKNPVIYVNNEDSPRLKELHNNLMLALRAKLGFTENETSLQFTPHMTIGFRDLTLENFDKAWDEFKERKYQAEFSVNKLSLLKMNQKLKKWEVHKEFHFPEG